MLTSFHSRWSRLAVALSGILVFASIGIALQRYQDKGMPFPSGPVSTSTPLGFSSATILTASSSVSGSQTYRNAEYGFEFAYPSDWAVEENAFGSYYSKFNLVVAPATERHELAPVLVNIVLPEFADRTFRDVKKAASDVTVAGVRGIKYEYEFEGLPEVAIVLPFGEYRMILGTTTNDYRRVFEEVLLSFKFLKH